jgi:lysophospholipase L1-like esterase
MSNICIFGDSIAYGYYDSEGGWVDRLKRYYFQTGIDASVHNQAVSGDITDDILKRFKVECDAREPDVILFALGINDSQWLVDENQLRTDPVKFKRNLSELLTLAQTYTRKVFFIGLTNIDEDKVTPCPWKPSKAYYTRYVEKYNGIIESFCQEKSVPFISLSGILGIADLEDGLHPNTKGHQKMFEYLKEKFTQMNIV